VSGIAASHAAQIASSTSDAFGSPATGTHTVRSRVSVTLPAVAVIVVVPAATAVIAPVTASMVATLGLLDE
jgi:hypothetical protein